MIGSLTLDQLRVLVSIADEGGFSAAGRALGRVQSAISQAIKTLEDIHQVELFDRIGYRPELTPIGRVLVEQARAVLRTAERFEAIAEGAKQGLEPSLSLAIDPLVPTDPIIESIKGLRRTFPDLPVSFFTEGLDGAERRLRAGSASLAFCMLLPTVPEDLQAYPLLNRELVAVAASTHPLACLDRDLGADDLEAHVQLVLSSSLENDGPNYGVVSTRIWKFADLGRRLDFLLAGLGWCRMPLHLVDPFIKAGRLRELNLSDGAVPRAEALPVYAAHMRGRPLGRAGTWLLSDLRNRLAVE